MDMLLKEKEVEDMVGFQISKIKRMIKSDEFPQPVVFGNRPRWKQSKILEWIHEL